MPRLSILMAALVAGQVAQADDPPRPPNVVVILADDLGYADLGVHGGTDVPTPNIDALARSGVRCTNGYVSNPYCSPTRAGLLTGRYPQRFGHEFNPALVKNGGSGQGLDPRESTLSARLKEAGYATAIVGKWHLGEEEPFHPLNRGFDEFFGFLTGAHSYYDTDDPNYGPITRGRERVEIDGYLTDVLAAEARAFIGRNAERPFFLYLPFNAVHTPMHPPERADRPVAKGAGPRRDDYLKMVAGLDKAVGSVLEALSAAGLDERTMVVFLSDNGGPSGGKFAPNASSNGALRGGKGDTWEGGIRVPFFVRWSGVLPAHTVYEPPVISLDIAATALAAAGVAIDPAWKLDGVDLVPAFLGGADRPPPHESLFWRFDDQMAIRKVPWKLVRADRSRDQPFGDVADRPILVNLADDPGESTDLTAQHPDKARELSADWQSWNATLAKPKWLDGALARRRDPAQAPAAKATTKKAAAKTQDPGPPPSLANVQYGDHDRQVFDLYLAESTAPTPLVVFIHGGGWTSGDKSGATRSLRIRQLQAAGISVAAIHYRLIPQAQEAGIEPPVRWPLEDAARAVQTFRQRAAEWNVDPTRIAATGGSAGACSSLYLAFHDDLARPDDPDPIARQSTRLSCAAVVGAQTTLDPKQMKSWIPNANYGGHAFGFRAPGRSRPDEFRELLADYDRVLPWIKQYSPIEHATADDPPIYLVFAKQETPPVVGTDQHDPTHSAIFGIKLRERLDELKVPCELAAPGVEPDATHPDVTSYLLDHFANGRGRSR